MLNYFFNVEEDNKKLFSGLSVYQNSRIMNHCSKYPIIYITFKDIKESSFEKSIIKIGMLIEKEFARHKKAIFSVDLEEKERQLIDRLLITSAIGDTTIFNP